MAYEGKKARPTYSRYRLKKAASHVAYEWWMLWHCLDPANLGSHRSGWEYLPDWNAGLEGFLLHYRNLLDFLAPRPSSHDTDILAVDFVAGFRARKPPTKYRKPIDQHLSHLTYNRTRKRGWPVATMVDELWEVWEQFSEGLGSQFPRRCVWFGEIWDDPRQG